ncbi:MAG: hypothetical protein WEB29_03135 [Chloroflexota bacterium]
MLELTPDESSVLDSLADRHGTIRGAVLAGLRELEANRNAALEAQAADLSKRLESAERDVQAERDQSTAEVAALNEELAASRTALKLAQGQTKEVRADLRETRAKQSNQTAARRAAEAARQAAEALRVHYAYCATCDKLVPEAEWAEQPWGNGFATYHKAHPFREKNGGLLGQPATVLFWRGRSTADGTQ